MQYITYDMAKAVVDMHTREAEARAELERMLEEAGVDRHGWLHWQGRRLLGGLGHRLVVWGRRLERYEVPQAIPMERSLSTGR
jgi:hypothetical protein